MIANERPAVTCEGLVRRFGSFTAVDGVSFEVATGEVFGLLGANGSGKSTTIRMLTGIMRPTAGRATVAGVDVVRDPVAVRERIGYVAQKVSLYPNLRVEENIAFYGGIYGLSGAELAARVAERAEALGLDRSEMRAFACDLPAGMRQRLAILIALLHRPRVLFLDEPTAGVDLTHRRALFDLMYGLAREGTTLLVTSHHLDEMERCSRLALIDHGQLLGVGHPDILKDSLEGGRRFAISLEGANRVAQAVAELRAAGFRAETAGGNPPASLFAWVRAPAEQVKLVAAVGRLPGRASLSLAPPTLEAVFTKVVLQRRAMGAESPTPSAETRL